MTEEFRATFQELIDTSVTADTRFPTAVQRVYHLALQVPGEERELAMQALGPVLAGDHTTPGVAADLMVLAGALVEMGTDPGGTGVEVLRRLRRTGQDAAGFLHAWNVTGGGAPPAPDSVTDTEEQRVATVAGTDAPAVTVAWWTVRRCAVATITMLNEPGVRAAVRADADLRAGLVAVANQLAGVLWELDEIRVLLRMAEATSALVLHRASGRAFRVVFDGIGDNFQLHTLLADTLVGAEGQGLAGQRPDPRWTAAYRDADPDPQARIVRGWWSLLAANGAWVWNDGVPADIPTLDGEHVLVLDEQPHRRSWTAGRRHPRVRGWLMVDEELCAQERAGWWRRIVPSEAPAPPAEPGEAAQPHRAEVAEPPDPVAAPGPRVATDTPSTRPDPAAQPPASDTAPTVDTGPFPAAASPVAQPPAPPTAALPVVGAPDRPPQGTDTDEDAPDADDATLGEDDAPPAASFLPPPPPGVSDASAWGPTWL